MAERGLRPAVADPEPPVARAQAADPLRLAVGLPADQRGAAATSARAPAASPSSPSTGWCCPFTGSYADFEHVLQHEMVHAFQYDVFSRGRAGARRPGASPRSTRRCGSSRGWRSTSRSGPVDPHTAMWLRDAAIEGNLPTIEQLTYDPRIFPYRYGHALWAYIGQKWGDEVIGAILQATMTGGDRAGVPPGPGPLPRPPLATSGATRCRPWYLPQIAEHQKARQFARVVLDKKQSGGTLHVSPQISPDGRRIVYLSERNFFFVDLYLADAESGRVDRRLIRSSFDPNFETLRFVNSTGSWSADGQRFAIAVKSGDQDNLVILDVRARPHRGPLPPGPQRHPQPDLVAGRLAPRLHRLRRRHLRPVRGGQRRRRTCAASPTTATPTSRRRGRPTGAPSRSPRTAAPSPTSTCCASGTCASRCTTSTPTPSRCCRRWTPGRTSTRSGRPTAGRSPSSRTGAASTTCSCTTSATGDVYQLTHAFTGITGITDLSPAISWARQADRLVFTYYEDGALQRLRHRQPAQPAARAVARGRPAPTWPSGNASALPVGDARAGGGHRPARRRHGGGRPRGDGGTGAGARSRRRPSIYRSGGGQFRPSDTRPAADSGGAGPISVQRMLDSASLALPDTADFAFHPYQVRFTPDYVSRPTIGYTRDNFGRGIFGGSDRPALGHARQPHPALLRDGERAALGGAGPGGLHQLGPPLELGRRRVAAAAVPATATRRTSVGTGPNGGDVLDGAPLPATCSGRRSSQSIYPINQFRRHRDGDAVHQHRPVVAQPA